MTSLYGDRVGIDWSMKTEGKETLKSQSSQSWEESRPEREEGSVRDDSVRNVWAVSDGACKFRSFTQSESQHLFHHCSDPGPSTRLSDLDLSFFSCLFSVGPLSQQAQVSWAGPHAQLLPSTCHGNLGTALSIWRWWSCAQSELVYLYNVLYSS